MNNQAFEKAAFLAGLNNNILYREHVLSPIARERERWESVVNNLEATEKQLYQAQGALYALNILEQILEAGTKRLRQMTKKEEHGTSNARR